MMNHKENIIKTSFTKKQDYEKELSRKNLPGQIEDASKQLI